MQLGNYLSEILSVAVSVVLFILTYKRTIGARKERATSANREIETILVRRLIQENYLPTAEEIARILDTKARDSRVRLSQLLNADQFINNAFTRVLESDFISSEKRESLLQQVSDWLESSSEKTLEEDTLEGAISSARSRTMATTLAAIAIAAAASFVGSLLVALPEIGANLNSLQNVVPMLVATTSASLAILTVFVFVNRMRERMQEEPEPTHPVVEAMRFERQVMRVVRKAGYRPKRGSIRAGYDFCFSRKDRKVLVEVKNWSGRAPLPFLDRSIENLRRAMNAEDANEGIVVTRNAIRVPPQHVQYENVKILSLRKFGVYLRKNR